LQRRKKLIFWRIEKRLRQKDIAERLGVTNGHYSSIEKGINNPSYEILMRFRDEFKVNDVVSLFEKENQNGY
jgi:transcriptional regulator with XRE-family HTH domain